MPEREVQVVRVAKADLPSDPASFAGVLITGSAASLVQPPLWLEPLHAFVERTLAQDTPLLGVCFGHQLLAEVWAGSGTVRRRTRPEVGWKEVRFVSNTGLWQAFPDRFKVFVSHEDEVPASTRGLDIVAQTDECAVHAFGVPGHRAWGVQFHSEMALAEIGFILGLRAAKHPELGLQPQQLMQQIRSRRALATQLFSGFLEVCEAQ